ncbi:MAG TPA: DUF1585 domain-containing protein [Deltaproteobacteria bacterium]|nr:DUF1585 domain-containing protein [Deltaproteobacteria bacterium]
MARASLMRGWTCATPLGRSWRGLGWSGRSWRGLGWIGLGCVGSACMEPPTEPQGAWLTPVEHAVRASLTVRGLRPSAAELTTVQQDPAALDGLISTWLTEPAFGEVVRDLHAEILRIRVDTVQQFPARGLLRGVELGQINRSTTEAPLRLIEAIVTEGRPYTEILTADWILADQTLATIYGLPYDPEGAQWQRTWWTDGRPAAGLLSSSELYHRYPSNGSNFHRGRANVIASTFLCDDIGQRPIAVEDTPVATDVADVVEALSHDPGCAGCHQALEPIASFLWGFKAVLPPKSMAAYEAIDCEVEGYDEQELLPPAAGFAEDLCYPLRLYHPAEERTWESLGLPAPALYGRPGERIDDLGRMITEDPRFAICTARRFAGYLLQADPETLDHAMVTELAESLVASGFDARALIHRIVTSDAFRAAQPRHVLRPEAYARSLEALTGFVWLGAHADGCDPETCWGTVDLANSDLFGFRTLAGGMDGIQRTAPTHVPTPSKHLVWVRLASEAADAVVDADLAEPDPSRRRLLRALGPDPAHPIRSQLVALQLAILSEAVAPDDVQILRLEAVFAEAMARHGDPARAWKLVITALLTDPRGVLL